MEENNTNNVSVSETPVSTNPEVTTAVPVEEPVTPEETSNDSQVMSEDLLSQQPLMASLMSNPLPETTPTPEPANPVLASAPVETTQDVLPISQPETINLNSEEITTPEEPVDMSQFQPPSIHVETADEPLPKEKKKLNLKPLIIALVVVLIGVGGFFGYKTFFGGVNPFVKKIDNIADALEYFEKELDIKLERNEYSKEIDSNEYAYDDNSIRVEIGGDKDGKLVYVHYSSSKDNFDKLIKVMTPFIKNYEDSKTMDNGIKIAKKIGAFNYYSKQNDFSISKDAEEGAVFSIKYNKGNKENYEEQAEVINDSTIRLTTGNSKLDVSIKKKYGKFDFTDVDVMFSYVSISFGSILKESNYIDIMIAPTEIVPIEHLSSSKVGLKKSEDVKKNGFNGHVFVYTSTMGAEDEVVCWEYVIAADGSKIDFDSKKEIEVFDVGILFPKEMNISEEEQEALFDDVINSLKLG